MDGDGGHRPGPDEEGIRRAGSAEEAVTAALHHEADVVGAGEADGGGDIRRTLRCDHIRAGRGSPGVQPAGVLRQTRLIAEIERVAEQFVCCWVVEIGQRDWREPATHRTLQLGPIRLARPTGHAGPHLADERASRRRETHH